MYITKQDRSRLISLNIKRVSILLLISLSNLFDTVEHKIEHNGLRGTALQY